jgi:CBS-domain-containing membrane protein
MRHHTVADVMTTDIITVTPQTSFKDLARLFVERQIGALPVLARNGTVTGIVREADLLKKAELQRDLGTGQPLRWRRGLHATAEATIAGEVMTTRVVPVSPGTTLGDAAWLMDKHHVPCLPVVTGDGTLAGVVTPRDLLRVFLRPDEDIRREIVDDVLPAFLGVEPALVRVSVRDGMVTVTGEVERKSVIALVLPLVRAVDGVVDAKADLTYTVDDSDRLAAAPRPPSWPLSA